MNKKKRNKRIENGVNIQVRIPHDEFVEWKIEMVKRRESWQNLLLRLLRQEFEYDLDELENELKDVVGG